MQNTTRYVIPQACAKIAYSILSAKRDTLRDVSIVYVPLSLVYIATA